MFWYDILCKTIYGKEKIKDKIPNIKKKFDHKLPI